MADTAISGLADGSSIQTTDQLAVNRGGANFRVVVGDLAPLDTVATAQIDNDAVTTAKILNANVTTAKIADGNVTLAKLADMATDSFLGRDTAGTGVPEVLSASTARTILNVADGATDKPVESLIIAVSDETTDLTTGTAKTTFRMPYAFTLTEVRASVTTAPTGSVLTVDINETATTILSTKITIDVSENTSTTAATAPVISDSSLADDAEMTIDIDTIGSTIAGAGLKVTLIGNRT